MGEAAAADHALDGLTTALDHLVKVVDDGGLGSFDNGRLLEFLQSFERVRNRLSLVDHRAIADCDRRGLADALTQPSIRRVLVQLLRLSPGEASRRVSAAQACGERISMLGEVLPSVRPHLSTAQRDGSVSPEQVDIITRALDKVSCAGFDPADIDAGERLLTDFAQTFGTKDLKRLADQTVDAINPDGTVPDDALNADRRQLTMRQCRDGMYAGEFRLSGCVGAKLTALLQPLARPRIDKMTVPDDASLGSVDERTFGQRSHDALEEICDRVLRAGNVVGTGGAPATVIVTVTLEDLLDKLGYATTSDGTLVSTEELLLLANEAEIIPAVMNRAGMPLSLGRSRRIASSSQSHALIARDRGCSFPGCDRAPEWCERHHIVEWVDGGFTDVDNLTLLCRYHHHNFAGGGWTCRMNADQLPEWMPPRWVDRSQRPLVNSRVLAHLPSWRQRRRRRADPRGSPASQPAPPLGVDR